MGPVYKSTRHAWRILAVGRESSIIRPVSMVLGEYPAGFRGWFRCLWYRIFDSITVFPDRLYMIRVKEIHWEFA